MQRENRNNVRNVEKSSPGFLLALANREAKWSLALTGLYFLGWYLSAYGFGGASAARLWGLPAWCALSCVVLPIVFAVAVAFVVRFVFVEIPLDEGDGEGASS